MPIQVDRPIRILSHEQFAPIAFEVKGQAFAIHSELGRFFDEHVNRKDLAAYESHLRRFLDHTGLERLRWANITLGDVSFREVRKKN